MFTQEQIRKALLLYAVTDSAWLGARTLSECVSQAIDGGATFVQLREKHATTLELIELGEPLRDLCQHVRIPFVVNDDIEAALALNADGVHVGQDDCSCAYARQMLGPDKIVGVSVQTLEQALAAQEAGASYLGVGAVMGTPTKPDAVEVDGKTLQAICSAVSIPVVIIGGLNLETIEEFSGCGVDGAAVVSAIFAADDIYAATKTLRALCDKTFV